MPIVSVKTYTVIVTHMSKFVEEISRCTKHTQPYVIDISRFKTRKAFFVLFDKQAKSGAQLSRAEMYGVHPVNSNGVYQGFLKLFLALGPTIHSSEISNNVNHPVINFSNNLTLSPVVLNWHARLVPGMSNESEMRTKAQLCALFGGTSTDHIDSIDVSPGTH